MAKFFPRWEFASGGFRAGIVVVAAALVFGSFVLTSTLTVVQGLAAFGILSLAAVLAGAAGKKSPPANVTDKLPELGGNSILQSVISSLPDAVLALSQQGRVLAFNAQAAELVPGLRRGGLGLVAIRIPA